MMYETPELECYGTFRELTKGGGATETDPFFGDPTIGCQNPPGPGIVCLSS